MQLSVSGHHIEVTDALRSYVISKFERLERHYDHMTNVHVVLSVEKLRHKAEATVHISGAEVFADAVEDDLYAAIDALAHIETSSSLVIEMSFSRDSGHVSLISVASSAALLRIAVYFSGCPALGA